MKCYNVSLGFVNVIKINLFKINNIVIYIINDLFEFVYIWFVIVDDLKVIIDVVLKYYIIIFWFIESRNKNFCNKFIVVYDGV